MLAAQTTRGQHAVTFEEYLKEHGVTSIHAFARLMAEADDDVSHSNFERWRQNAYRWRRGGSISDEIAEIVADRLGVDTDEMILALNAPRATVDNSVLARMESMETEIRESRLLLDELVAAIRRQQPEPPADQPPEPQQP